MAKDEKELNDVMRQELSRGRRRPIRAEDREHYRRMMETYRELLNERDESRAIEILYGFGLTEGSPEFSSALAAWRAHRRRIETSSS